MKYFIDLGMQRDENHVKRDGIIDLAGSSETEAAPRSRSSARLMGFGNIFPFGEFVDGKVKLSVALSAKPSERASEAHSCVAPRRRVVDPSCGWIITPSLSVARVRGPHGLTPGSILIDGDPRAR